MINKFEFSAKEKGINILILGAIHGNETAGPKAISRLIDEINNELSWQGVKIETNTEYNPEQLQDIASNYYDLWKLDSSTFVYGRGHRKTQQQKHY